MPVLFLSLACDPVDLERADSDIVEGSEAPESQVLDDSERQDTVVVYVNELSAGADWVELFASEPVDLQGLTISDDYTKPEKQLLSGSLDGYVVVELSDFGLAGDGEAVGVFDNGQALDWVLFPALEDDEVYARVPDASEDWETMVRGTPGEANRVVVVEEIAAVVSGATWSYLDGGVAPDEGWDQPGFDASAWASGPSPLGYGDAQTTVVSYGDDSSNKHVTTWMRHSFEHTGDATDADVGLVCDDGCLVRLNGEEIFRFGLPDGDLSSDTLANVTASGSAETEWRTRAVDPSLLVEGENVLSAEVHQVSPSSSDLTFNGSLDLVVVH